MALDINTGYSSTFKAFVDFAEKTNADGYDSASAKATLSSRTITVSPLSLHETSYFLRKGAEEKSNDATRALFRAAIIDMFGGEDKIPENVKDAMMLNDYGHGKPLSARRILSVKAAIDGNNTVAVARAKSQAVTDKFKSPAVEAKAVEMGFSKAELPKLARATARYMEYSAMMENPPKTEMEAMQEIAKPGSKAGRLALYGGRFLESAENFSAGMKLLSYFGVWFNDVRGYCNDNPRDRNTADSDTKRFMSYDLAVDDTTVRGLEKMVFQELATNPDINLQATDKEYLFGIKHNAAMRFFGRNCHESMLGTVFNVPPEKRRVLFAAFDAFMPLGGNGKIENNRLFAARVLNHLEELSELMDKGKFTTKNIIKTCFPDITKTGGYDLAALNGWFGGIDAEINAAGIAKRSDCDAVRDKMAESGCTVKEAVESFKSGAPIQPGAYQIGYSMELHEFPDGGFEQMKADMKRAYNYAPLDGNGNADNNRPLLPAPHAHHTIVFPDGKAFACGSKGKLRENTESIADKVRELCGAAHELQANIVGCCLSQSVNAPIRGALKSFGIYADEHVALDYTLSKNDDTGAVTIRYSSPAELPVKFSWSCTVNVDGTCSTTPIAVEGEMKSIGKIATGKAREMVDDSVARLGLEGVFDKGKRELAVMYLEKYGGGLPATNARILSNYVVNILMYGGGDEGDVKKLADGMKSWRMFAMGDPNLAALGQKFVERQNDYVKEILDKPGSGFSKVHPDMFAQLELDADRGFWDVNGTLLHQENSDLVVDKFLETVKDPNARKVVSTLLNQGNFSDVEGILARCPMPVWNGAEGGQELLNDIKGAEMFISKRRADDAEVVDPIVKDSGHLEYKLNISQDGKTAYLTITTGKDIIAALDDTRPRKIGTAMVSVMSTVDLTKEIPEVTNVTFAQSFSEKINQ